MTQCRISSQALAHVLQLCAAELCTLEQALAGEHSSADTAAAGVAIQGMADEERASLQEYHLSAWKLYCEMADTYVGAYDPQSNMTKPSSFLAIYPLWIDQHTLLWQEAGPTDTFVHEPDAEV